ncbi:MAG TPA: DUF5676 family membrane protein [Candidatus Paceibacterota bacterium]
MNTMRAVKIGLAWINITYVLCYVLLGLLPATRPSILPYILHLNVGPVENIFTLGNFIVGLILWNVIVGASIWLVGLLAGYIKN